MATQEDHEKRLHWTGGGWNSEPVWPREPDVEVIKLLVKARLGAQLPADFQDASPKVTFFAEGGFNKLYRISFMGHDTDYLLRVTLPIEPFYKTESEVATITYLRANTTIPVPRVFAWSSNSNNELTFEWILMEKLNGVPLYDLWPRKVPWERKLELTSTVAGFVEQLRNCRFDRIGGLYFQSAIDCGTRNAEKKVVSEAAFLGSPAAKHPDDTIVVNHSDTVRSSIEEADLHPLINVGTMDQQQHELRASATIGPLPATQDTMSTKCGEGVQFRVGRVFDPVFIRGSRLYLPGNRGPYQSSLEWLSAEIQIQLEWIKRDPVEDDEDYDDDFAEEAPIMERLFQEYLDILPKVYKTGEETDYTLHHSDLNAANILVDPKTLEITGIVDWEMINVVPAWRASEQPKFLGYMKPDDDEEPPLPSNDVNEEHISWELRDRWEHKALRSRFHKATARGRGGSNDEFDETKETKAKLDCYFFLSQLTGMWSWSEKWLKIYKRTGRSVNQADWTHPTYSTDEET